MTLAEILRKEGLEEWLEKGIEKGKILGIKKGDKLRSFNIDRYLIRI